MDRVHGFLQRHARWQVIGGLFALMASLGPVGVRFALARLRTQVPDVEPPDEMPRYTVEQLYTAIEAFGESGRRFYVLWAWTADLLAPLLYSSFLMLVATWLLLRVAPRPPLRHLALLPALVGVLDVAENTCTSLLTARWPERLDGLASVATVVSRLKWLSMQTTLSMLAVLGLAAAGMAIRRRLTAA